MQSSHDQTASPADGSLRRRTLFRWLTYGLGALATVILAIPFVGYLFGALRKHNVEAWNRPKEKFFNVGAP